MTLLQPMALLAALSLPVIILLYMLKKRTRPQTVSSVLLWERLERISSPALRINRLLRNLLFYLQLLAALLLVLALARPALDWAGALGGRDRVLIIDTSVSMGVADSAGGTRLDRALAEARQLVNSKSGRDQIGIVAMGEEATIISGLTANAATLLSGLERVNIDSGQANAAAALLLAENMAHSLEEPELVLLSDGVFAEVPQRLDYSLTYFAVGTTEVRNLALEDLLGDGERLYLTVLNNGTEEVAATIQVSDDKGAVVGRREIRVVPGERTVQVWRNLPASSWYRATTQGDDLAWDNEIYATVGERSDERLLLISEGNLFLERALMLTPGLTVSKVAPERYHSEMAANHDYFVFDGYLPAQLPQAPLLVFDPPHPNSHMETAAPTELADVTPAAHRLLEWVDFTEVNISFAKSLRGGQVLLQSDRGPVAAEYSNQGHPLVAFGFAVQAGDLPLRPAFPILMRNILDYFRGYQVDLGEFRFGRMPLIQPPYAAETVSLQAPDGSLSAGSAPWPHQGPVLDEPGIYTLTIDGSEFLVPVNPPATSENLSARSTINIAGEPRDSQRRGGQLPLFMPLALFALAVIGLEWWVDNSGY